MDDPVVLGLRLGLVAAAVAGASLAARRGGHGVAGVITGMPVIVGPLMGFLLLDHPPAQVQAIALATLVCLPATLLHGLCFAWCATRWPWGVCIVLATLAYGAAAALLAGLGLPAWVSLGLAAAVPWLTPRMMPLALQGPGRSAGTPSAAPPQIPDSEVIWRVLAALAVAAGVLLGAPTLPAAVSGALVAIPIAGSVLPCFTLPLHGVAATVRLLSGFARGLRGFMAFMAVLYLALGQAPSAWVFAAAVLAALLASPAGFSALARLLPIRPVADGQRRRP